MTIYIGADHRGYSLKEELKKVLLDRSDTVVDMGTDGTDPEDDYVDYAATVAEAVTRDPHAAKGIVICGSGVAADIVANKFPDVRSALGFTSDQVRAARHDDDVNVLALAANFTSSKDAKAFVKIFLDTPFGDEERYRRRLNKIGDVEARLNISL